MTNEEAIETLRANYPDVCFGQLREAVDMAINALTAQDDSKELSFTHKALDTVSRQAVIRWVKTECNPYGKPTLDFESGKKVIEHLKQMSSAQPEHTNSCYTNSWCIDCKEYDTENKCCPRYNRVIKQTLDDAYRHGETEAEARFHDEIVRCKDCKHQVKEWRTDKRLKDKGYMVCGCEVVGDACGYWALLGQDDDYCSYAERRTDG